MKPLYILVLLAFLPLSAAAQETPAAPVFEPLVASEVSTADLMWIKRPIVVFADSANDPAFVTQMRMLAQDPVALETRDVVVIIDTDPEAKSEWRLKLRPRGFSLVLLDKDLEPELRKPLPWDVREITRAIDKFPLRRQEVLVEQPAGR